MEMYLAKYKCCLPLSSVRAVLTSAWRGRPMKSSTDRRITSTNLLLLFVWAMRFNKVTEMDCDFFSGATHVRLSADRILAINISRATLTRDDKNWVWSLSSEKEVMLPTRCICFWRNLRLRTRCGWSASTLDVIGGRPAWWRSSRKLHNLVSAFLIWSCAGGMEQTTSLCVCCHLFVVN